MKKKVGSIMIAIGCLGGFLSGIYSLCLKFSNPDMTSTRLWIENPNLLFCVIIPVFFLGVGYKLIKK